jgi:hypothetical protein
MSPLNKFTKHCFVELSKWGQPGVAKANLSIKDSITNSANERLRPLKEELS